jgi:hypothetical protein
MRRWFLATALACTVIALAVTILIAASSDEPSDKPQYNKGVENCCGQRTIASGYFFLPASA